MQICLHFDCTLASLYPEFDLSLTGHLKIRSTHFFYHNPIYFPSFDPLVNDGKNCRATLIIEQDLTRLRDLEIKLANLVDITCLFRPFFVQLVREIPRVAEAINFIRGPEVLLLLIFRISYLEKVEYCILRLQIAYLMLIWP